jgi:hypothetical protein
MALEIEHVDIDTLRPYPGNPRNGDVDAIADSIRANGLYKPVVIAEDGVVLAGNHTYFAAMQLGLAEMPVVRLPIPSDSAEARRVVLVDNRTSDRAQYDEGELLMLLRSMEGDLFGTGWESDDVAVLAAYLDKQLVEPLDLSNVGGPTDHTMSLLITGLTNQEVGAWRMLPGGTDAERLRGVISR